MWNFTFLLQGDQHIPLCIEEKKKEYINTKMKNVWYFLKRYLLWWRPRSSSFLRLFGTGMSVSSTSSVSWWPWLSARWWPWLSARWWPWPSARWWLRSPRWMRSFYCNKEGVLFNEIKCYFTSTIFWDLGNDFPQEGIKFF